MTRQTQAFEIGPLGGERFSALVSVPEDPILASPVPTSSWLLALSALGRLFTGSGRERQRPFIVSSDL